MAIPEVERPFVIETEPAARPDDDLEEIPEMDEDDQVLMRAIEMYEDEGLGWSQGWGSRHVQKHCILGAVSVARHGYNRDGYVKEDPRFFKASVLRRIARGIWGIDPPRRIRKNELAAAIMKHNDHRGFRSKRDVVAALRRALLSK